MHYKTVTIWIFTFLMLVIFLLIVYPTNFLIWVGVAGLPLLLLVQTIAVLRAGEESQHTFSDDKWYEDC
jgi:hypothetical protein